MKYEVIYEKYERYEVGDLIHAVFSAKNLVEAANRLCNNVNLYIDRDTIVNEKDKNEMDLDEAKEFYTPDEFLEELDSMNGDGCDYVHLFKNLTTGETYFRSIGFQEQNWDSKEN